MPIYGYKCQQCGHELEIFQSMSAEPLRTCPDCMGPLRKMMYPVGVQFKGSGFYSTDYKSSSNGSSKESAGKESADKESADKSSKSESESKSSSTGGGEGSSDSKPAKSETPKE